MNTYGSQTNLTTSLVEENNTKESSPMTLTNLFKFRRANNILTVAAAGGQISKHNILQGGCSGCCEIYVVATTCSSIL
jgi:hypothetical protein